MRSCFWTIAKLEEQFKKNGTDVSKMINYVLKENHVQFWVEKGTKWGIRLANYLNKKRNQEVENGDYSEDKLSKIEKQIEGIYRASQPHIDFPLSMENLDQESLEIQ